MHDLANVVYMLAFFVGAISTALATTHKATHKDYTSIIEELKSERDDYKERVRVLEDKVEILTKEIIKLRSKRIEVNSKNERK